MWSITIYCLTIALIGLSHSYQLAFGQYVSEEVLRVFDPIISSVDPVFGSTEGGSRVTISGANFIQGSALLNVLAVFIDEEACLIVSHYTTNNRVVCYTPRCFTWSCITDDDWQGFERVTLSVYMQIGKTIVGALSPYYYYGGATPAILKMSHYTWATSLSQVSGKLTSNKLEDFNIKIGDQFADLGFFNEINTEFYNPWSLSSQLRYRPPVDMSAGFYNLSLTVLNDPNYGNGVGLARMFPKQKSFLYELDYSFNYNFDTTLSGTPFSICLQPVITNISPSRGSVAGGTIVTVVGHGFSGSHDDMTVYVGGRICDVIAVTDSRYVPNFHGVTETFQCITRPVDDLEVLRRDLLVKSRVVTASSPSYVETAFQEYGFRDYSFLFTSHRTHGSPGWWMKLWDMSSYNSNDLTDRNVRISGGIRQGLSLGFWFDFGSNWFNTMNYGSTAFVADFATILTAPYSG